MNKTLKISPSLLAADFLKLKDEVIKVTDGKADYLHLDIMDGVFVPNISFGPDVVKTLRPITNLVFDVHLMIVDPIRYIETFVNAGADIITFHYESCDNAIEVINKIHLYGKKAGITIKPNTKVDEIANLIPLVELVLIMTVEPGFGGQKYIKEMNDKIKEVREIIDSTGKEIDLEVDGGINSETIKEASKNGADVFVAGTAIFKSENPKVTIETFKQIAIGEK